MSLFSSIRTELKSFSKTEKLFILFSMLAGFSIASEYAIVRPASQALFLTVFSSKAFPWVWLATVPLNLFVVYLYNRFLPKIGPLRLLTSIASAAISINLFCGFFLSYFPWFIFVHFAWKDIYILLMFKQLWSMIHSTIAAARAKYLYGIIFSMGTFGSILGSFVPGFFAVSLGSEKLFFFTLPIYILLIFAYRNAFQRSRVPKEEFAQNLTVNPKPSEGFALIKRNRFLAAVLFLVIFMQISVGLIEYQFNHHLELTILGKDLRTAYCGRLIGYMNMLSAFFQVIGGFLIVQTLGLRGSHFLIPIILLTSALFSWAIPTFALISFSYVFLKAVDFSLFSVVREMLYIPLQMDEKFRAKAIIDVFAYRTSKAFVSVFILILQFFAATHVAQLASYLSIAVFIGWLGIVAILFKRLTPSIPAAPLSSGPTQLN